MITRRNSSIHPSGLVPWDSSQQATSKGRAPLTAIVLTKDEEANIANCLRSLGWCESVVVVDSGSTDKTAEIARDHGAMVVFNPFESFGKQREWAMNCPEIETDWVFFVDADEWVSTSLAEEISETIANPRADAYAMRLRLIFQEKWIRFASWYSGSWVVRLARRSVATCEGDVSEKIAVPGPIGLLANDLVDDDQKPFSTWLAKHNTYSTLKAQGRFALAAEPIGMRFSRVLKTRPPRRILREVAKQVIAPTLPAAGLVRFLNMYIVTGGFLMGRVGLRFCLLHGMQEVHIAMKLAELKAAEAETASAGSKVTA